MAYLSKGFLIQFYFFFNYKVSDEFVSICALLALYAPSRRFDINSRLKKLSFS